MNNKQVSLFSSIIFIILVLVNCTNIIGQDTLQVGSGKKQDKHEYKKNGIALNLTQLHIGEFKLGIERRISKRHSLGLEFSYKINKRDYYESGPTYQNETPYIAVNAYSLGVSHQYVFAESSRKNILFIL